VAAVAPEGLFTVAPDRPDTAGLVLVEMLDGFIDAGGARRLAREQMTATGDAVPVVSFDADLLHDYRARRPPMMFVQDHWESYDAPQIAIVGLRDSAGSPYLLLHGSEPDVMWDRFASALVQIVDELGVRLTVGTNAIPMGVPHTRPVAITAHASRPELVADYQPWVGTVQVPGSAAHLIEHRLAVTGHDSMGFAVHVPHYLAQAGFPPAAEALLAAIDRATGLSLPTGSLPEASREAHETIAGLVAQSDELSELVRTLETQYDAIVAARGEALAGGIAGRELPTADELGAELERFLAEQSKRRDDG
jgi:hypothetical protein